MTTATEVMTRVATLEKGQVDTMELHRETVATVKEIVVMVREMKQVQAICQSRKEDAEKRKIEYREKAKHVGMVVTVTVLVFTAVGTCSVWVWDKIHPAIQHAPHQ